MSADWPFIELGELVNEITVGFVGSMMHEYVDDGVPFFRSKNISEYEIEWNDIRYISQDFHRRLKKSVLRPGDVVIVRTGKPGTTCVIPDSIDEANCSDIVIVRVNNDKLSAHYLSYFMNSIASHQVSSHLVGAVQQHFNVGSAKKIKIPLPTRDEQEEIVKILKSLDDKRKLNRQINQTLESMAQAIFKNWFVDFEPVKAKIAAIEAGVDAEDVTCAAMRAISGTTDDELDQMQAKQPDHYAQLKTTAELFPAVMQDSELGEIPLGWEIGCIGDIAKAKGGYAYKSKSFIEVGNPVVKIKNIVGNGTVDLEDCQRINGVYADATGSFLLKDGDLLMAMTGATVGKVGLIVIDGKKAFVNQRVAKFESEKFGDKASWFLFCAFRRDPVFDAVVGAAQGSAQPNISSSGIESTAIVLPRDDCINEFSNRVDSLFRKWMNNFSENLRLSEIRDTLLPKLLSGELEIKAVNKAEI